MPPIRPAAATLTGPIVATSITDSGGETIAGNDAIAGNLTVTGSATLGPLTASSVTNSGNESIAGTLSVTGASTLQATTFTPGGVANGLVISKDVGAFPNVGIGTAPFAGRALQVQSQTNDNQSYGLVVANPASTATLAVRGDGYVFTNGTGYSHGGTSSAAGVSYGFGRNLGLYFPAANQLGLATNGVAALTIDASQQTTIGGGGYCFVTSPSGLRATSAVFVNAGNGGGYLGLGTQAQSPSVVKLATGYYQVQDYGTGTKPSYILQGCYPASKTANYTLVFADMDTHFDNTGAVGPVAFTMPAPQVGYRAWFCCTAAQVLTVTTPTGSIFAPGLTGATRTVTGTTAANQYTSFCAECKDGTNYVVTCLTGTLT